MTPYTVTLNLRIPTAPHPQGALALAKRIAKQGRLDEFIVTETAERVAPPTWKTAFQPKRKQP